MKRTVVICAALALLCLTACDGTTAAWAFESAGRRTVDGVEYYFNKAGNYAFVSAFEWDGEGDAELTVPDEVEGAEVFGVGGYFGTGVPLAAGLAGEGLETVGAGDEEWLDGTYPGGWRTEDVTLTLHIGANVSRVMLASDCLAREEDGSAVLYCPRWYLVCDPGNETFRSENGRLYRLSDGEEVDISGYYWNEEREETE